MKHYSAHDQLTLVGKAWEIRHKLRQMTRQNYTPQPLDKSAFTLVEYLNRRQTKL